MSEPAERPEDPQPPAERPEDPHPPADLDKAPASATHCRNDHENSHRFDNAQPRRAICRFHQVRAQGEQEIIRLASLQHGHLHRIQLQAAGWGRGAIEHRLRTGWLRPTFPSVFHVGPGDNGRMGSRMAAALHFKGSALVADLDAADLWLMLDTTQRLPSHRPIDVLRVGTASSTVAGIHVSRTLSLPPKDVRSRNGIPVTSPALTVLRLARFVSDLELETAASVGFRRHGLRVSQLKDVCARYPHAQGVARVRRLLDGPEQLRDTRSKWERKLLQLIAEAALPTPVTNVTVAGHMVDMLWPDLRLVAEFDGWAEHGKRPAFETDRLRDQDLAAIGHQALRITYRQVEQTPLALIARLGAVIATLRASR